MDRYLVCLNGDICHVRNRILVFSDVQLQITVGISLRRTARLTQPASPVPSVSPDERKCRSSARQTGYRCPRTILYKTCMAMSSSTPITPSYCPRKPRRATCTATLSPTFHVIACACPPIRRAIITRDLHQHHLRRSLAERAVLPSRTATHAPLSHTPRLRCVLPSRRTAFPRVKHSPWLASCRDTRG